MISYQKSVGNCHEYLLTEPFQCVRTAERVVTVYPSRRELVDNVYSPNVEGPRYVLAISFGLPWVDPPVLV